MEIPKASAKLANSVCDSISNSNAVAVFYNDYHANVRSCRILDVPMQQQSFLWAYNQVCLTAGLAAAAALCQWCISANAS